MYYTTTANQGRFNLANPSEVMFRNNREEDKEIGGREEDVG